VILGWVAGLLNLCAAPQTQRKSGAPLNALLVVGNALLVVGDRNGEQRLAAVAIRNQGSLAQQQEQGFSSCTPSVC